MKIRLHHPHVPKYLLHVHLRFLHLLFQVHQTRHYRWNLNLYHEHLDDDDRTTDLTYQTLLWHHSTHRTILTTDT